MRTGNKIVGIGIAALLGLAACIPLAQADSCRAVYHPAAATVVGDGSHVVTSAFEPLDVFVFVGAPTTPVPVLYAPAPPPAAAAPPPAGGQAEDLAGMPRAVGYFGRREPAAPRVDVKAVAEALGVCAACHTAPAGKNGVNLFAARGAFDPKVSPRAVYDAVKDDYMPLRGQKLTAEQKKLLQAWVAEAEKKGP